MQEQQGSALHRAPRDFHGEEVSLRLLRQKDGRKGEEREKQSQIVAACRAVSNMDRRPSSPALSGTAIRGSLPMFSTGTQTSKYVPNIEVV